MKKYILSALLPVFIFLYTLIPTLGAGDYTAYAPAHPHTPTSVAARADSSPATHADDTFDNAQVGGYACILYDDVFFYSEPNEKRGVFLLPKTYYVKILSLSPDFCQIEYLYDAANVKRLVGYAKTADLTFVPYTPKQPYLYKLIDVRYRLDNDSNVSFTSGIFDEITITCAYYGDYKIGSQTYCYVLRDDVFGYVPKPNGLTYDDNTEYAAWLDEQVQNVVGDNVQNPNQSATPAQIAILIALCLLVPVLAAFILRTGKRQTLDEDD